MSTARYLLVKHVPDMHRREPRNVGVLVWTPRGVAARFVGDKADAPGDVDGRSVPDFIRSKDAYRQWVRYWHRSVSRDRLSLRAGDSDVPRSDPRFLEALSSASRDDYPVTDGGFILDAIDGLEPDEVAESIYARLVEPASSVTEDAKDPGLAEICNALISSAGVSSHPHFHRGYELRCPLATGRAERFDAHYALANGMLKRVYHRVPVGSQRPRTAKKWVDACAWMFTRVRESFHMPQEHCVSLVHIADGDGDSETGDLLEVLRSVSKVINVAHQNDALAEFRAARQDLN